MKQSKGFIWVTSELGIGTTFDVFLPRVHPPTGAEVFKRVEAVDRGGTETILLVEDDDGVRSGISRLLAGRGYTVLSARGGNEASALAASHEHNIHLVLTDVVMPDMNGFEVVDAVRSHARGVKALFMSGFSDHQILQNGEVPQGLAFIHKPFSPTALSKKIREVLDADAR